MLSNEYICANAPSLQNHGLEDKLYEINYEGARPLFRVRKALA